MESVSFSSPQAEIACPDGLCNNAEADYPTISFRGIFTALVYQTIISEVEKKTFLNKVKLLRCKKRIK